MTNVPFFMTQIFKGNPKGPVRNMLVYPELMTTPLNITKLEVLIAIKKKRLYAISTTNERRHMKYKSKKVLIVP